MISDKLNLFVLSIILFPLIIAVSWWLTGRIHDYALKNAIMDYPNERSSHDLPKPRGGGLVIVVLSLISIIIFYILDLLPGLFVIAAIPGGVLIASTGWLDDKYGIKISVRMVIYFASSLWACYWFILHEVAIDALSIITYLIFTTGVAWLTNLYNFMDGTDGLAAVEAVSVTIPIAVLALFTGLHGLALLNFVIAAASAGFLIWNWPPARIFLGDAGSCYLGFVFGVMAVSCFAFFDFPFVSWLILLSVFICDATCTLFKRILNKEQWYKSHRSHSYQRIVQAGFSHQQLLVGLTLINMIVLWPSAVLVFIYKNIFLDILLLTISYTYLVLLWFGIQGYCSRNIKSTSVY